MSWIAVSFAYRANAWAQNWMTALVARSTSAVLKSKSFMRVAPTRIGRTVKSSRNRPTFVQPFTVTAAKARNEKINVSCL